MESCRKRDEVSTGALVVELDVSEVGRPPRRTTITIQQSVSVVHRVPGKHAEAGAISDAKDPLANWKPTRSNVVLRRYSDSATLKLLDRWLPDVHGRRILKTDLFDEAVGEGLYPALRDGGATVAAVDLSEAVLRAARVRYPELDATRADLRALPHRDGTFDVVVSNSTLDHFRSRKDIELALAELHRVLLPGGHLAITLDNPVNPLVALRNVLPQAPMRRIGLVPYFVGATCGPRALNSLLRSARFEIRDARALMHFPRVLARPIASASQVDPLVRFLLGFERLGRLPTRYATGQFVAVLAERPS